MFMRPTVFNPQVAYNARLSGHDEANLSGDGHDDDLDDSAIGDPQQDLGLIRGARLSRAEARLRFQTWLRRRFPLVADKASGFGPGAVMQLGDDAAPQSTWEKLLNLAPQAVAAASQYKIIKLNLARAEKGLPPIDTAIAAPTVKVQTQLDPESRRAVNYAGVGLAALGGLLALKLLKVI